MSKGVDFEHPPHSDELKVSFPVEHVLLLTFNRPDSLNAMTPTLTRDINNMLNWFDEEPSLWLVSLFLTRAIFLTMLSRVVIVTGAGRAFCAGADLKALVFKHNLSVLPKYLSRSDGTKTNKVVMHENKKALQPMSMGLGLYLVAKYLRSR